MLQSLLILCQIPDVAAITNVSTIVPGAAVSVTCVTVTVFGHKSVLSVVTDDCDKGEK